MAELTLYFVLQLGFQQSFQLDFHDSGVSVELDIYVDTLNINQNFTGWIPNI